MSKLQKMSLVLGSTLLAAPEEFRRWSVKYGSNWERAWDDCKRGDWLLWLCARLRIKPRLLVMASVECADMAIPLVPKRMSAAPKATLRVARAWTRGKATKRSIEEALVANVKAADQAESEEGSATRKADIYVSAASHSAINAAGAALYTAIAHEDLGAGEVNDYADNVADAAVSAANAVGYAAFFFGMREETAKRLALAEMADAVRSTIPWSKVERELGS